MFCDRIINLLQKRKSENILVVISYIVFVCKDTINMKFLLYTCTFDFFFQDKRRNRGLHDVKTVN